MPEVFEYRQGRSPLLLSSPHDGDAFPPQVQPRLSAEGQLNRDRDWFVSDLYSCIEELDLSVIRANYSRYVVDLNRSETGELLYPGKMETSICPLASFDGEPIYKEDEAPDEAEIQSRILSYWQPYHQHLRTELERLKSIHGYAILWDAHSIRAEVPRLFDGVLPDLNFGTNDGQSCARELAGQVLTTAENNSAYSIVLNGRFKGGYITRHYGDPKNNIHAIQLEINQSTYLAPSTDPVMDDRKAALLSSLLTRLLQLLTRPGITF